jgi:hypothetical protein
MLKMKGYKEVFQTNGVRKQAGVAISVLDKGNIKPKPVRRDKEDHFILIRRTIH